MGYLPYSAVFGDPPDLDTETSWVIRVVEEPGCTAEFVHSLDGRSLERYDLTIFATEEEAREEALKLIDEARKAREEGGKMSVKLVMDDLIGECPNCNGTGKLQQEARGGSGSSFGRRTITYTLGNNPEDCGRCLGTGRWGLTETGRTVGEFIEVYQKLKARGLDG